MKEIVVAGGCFWGVQAFYQRAKGVVDTTVGYAQGQGIHPTYEEVCKQEDQFVEVCRVVYDETILSLHKILEYLFRIIDPTSLNQQGNDIGIQYRTGVYYKDQEDREIILSFLQEQQINYDKKIVVECLELTSFYTAEAYHQKYLDKNPMGYCHIDLHKLHVEEMK